MNLDLFRFGSRTVVTCLAYCAIGLSEFELRSTLTILMNDGGNYLAVDRNGLADAGLRDSV